MIGVLFHVQQAKPTKTQAVAFISDYILNPHRSKSLCQDHSIQKFGVMPSMKEQLTPQEATRVSEYVYDRFAEKKWNNIQTENVSWLKNPIKIISNGTMW